MLRTLALLLSVALLGGCLDIVQYVSGSGSDIEVYLRLTLQKAIFGLAASFGDAPADLDSMFEEEFSLNESDVLAEMPAGVEAEFRQINSESEFGFELTYRAARDVLANMPEEEAPFVPRVTLRGLTIPLGEGGAEAETEDMADAFLGSAKYRLMISKMLVTRVSKARLMSGSESRPVTVTELPDIWLLEFPMSYWYSSAEPARIEVMF